MTLINFLINNLNFSLFLFIKILTGKNYIIISNLFPSQFVSFPIFFIPNSQLHQVFLINDCTVQKQDETMPHSDALAFKNKLINPPGSYPHL